MYFHHMYCSSYISLKMSSSNSAIINLLYGGAKFVPISVPHFCFKFFSLKVKIIAFKNNFNKFY